MMWADIPGFEGFYQVSDHGDVRGVDRMIGARRWKGKLIAQKVGKRGHRSVRLCRNRKHTFIGVHRLVLMAFVGPCPAMMEGAHNDGNPRNNSLKNLRLDTRTGNFSDMIQHGTKLLGERNHLSKLRKQDIPKIFALSKSSETGRAIAAKYGVTPANISLILRGKTWRGAHACL